MKPRHAQLEDLPVLLEFEQCVIEEERPFNDSIRAADVKYYDLDHLLSDPKSSLQVVEHDGRVIGCGYVQLRPSQSPFVHDTHGYMGFMYVVPELRGQGVNKIIVDSLISWGQDQGIVYFYLDVYAGNEAAIRAYEKAGFASELVEMKLNTGK